MTLVTLAGSSLSWEFCSKRMVPVSFSIRMAEPQSVAGAPETAEAGAAGRTRSAAARAAASNFFMWCFLHIFSN